MTKDRFIISPIWAISHDSDKILFLEKEKLTDKKQNFSILDLRTREIKKLDLIPNQMKSWTFAIPDFFSDGKKFYITARDQNNKYNSNIFIGDIEKESLTPIFDDDSRKDLFYDHAEKNPKNEKLLLYNQSHKNSFGKDNPQRMWLLNLENGDFRPVYKQKKKFWKPMERVGHEMWCGDGEHICYVVRRDKVKITYPYAEYGKEPTWIASKGPNAWHVSSSPNGKYLVFDTMWKDTGLWLVEFNKEKEGKRKNICLTKSEWQHPEADILTNLTYYDFHAHPHPGWAPNSKYIQFSRFDPNRKSVDIYVLELPDKIFKL